MDVVCAHCSTCADHMQSLAKILKIAYSWANGASGKPPLQLRRDWNVGYPAVFTLVHNLHRPCER